jgi:hypothetical protein
MGTPWPTWGCRAIKMATTLGPMPRPQVEMFVEYEGQSEQRNKKFINGNLLPIL